MEGPTTSYIRISGQNSSLIQVEIYLKKKFLQQDNPFDSYDDEN